jgi:hypothetical protein
MFHQDKAPAISNVATTTATSTAEAIATTTATTTPPASTARSNAVKVYYIAPEDNGASGKKIGCNDSAVSVTRTVTPTQSPLRAALETLLADKNQYFGESGLYNSLYQSNLSIQSLSIVNGTANIKLAGTFQLGGTCDAPRFKAQLEETAKQFSTVKNAVIFINNKPIDQALSSK